MVFQPTEPNVFRFAASSIERAQSIILTPSLTAPTEERWRLETEATASFLGKIIERNARVFDYGCGIGRVSKALLDLRPDLHIVGVETSPDMCSLATEYVANPTRFSLARSLNDFESGYFSFGFALYALQHVSVRRIRHDLPRIGEVIKRDGGFYLLDAKRRFVPEKSLIERFALLQRPKQLDVMVETIAREILPREKRWVWKDDGFKVAPQLGKMFDTCSEVPLAPDAFAPGIIENHNSLLFERSSGLSREP